MDPFCDVEQYVRFERLVSDILKSAKIDDDKWDVVVTLQKIETKFMELLEARNYLVQRDQIHRTHEKTIEQFERDLAKERNEKSVKDNEAERARKALLEAKMLRKKERMENMTDFRGLPTKPRSKKRDFKPIVVKKNDTDEQTKAEKHYLGPELFEVLKKSNFPAI